MTSTDMNDAAGAAIPPLSYGEVRAWANSFQRLMDHPLGRQLFKEYLTLEHSEENMNFWEAVQAYRLINDPDELADLAADITEQYLSANSKKEVSLDSRTKSLLMEKLKTPNQSTFDEAQLSAFKLMERDTWNRFTRSLLYRNFLETQISGEVVALWGKRFDALLEHEFGRQLFREFLQMERADENLRFWEAIQRYKRIPPSNTERLKEQAEAVYKEFISTDSATEISIDSVTRAKVTEKMATPSMSTFDEAELHIFQLMARDPYHRFTVSSSYKNFLKKRTAASEGTPQNTETEELPQADEQQP